MMLASTPVPSRLADNFFLARQPILNRGQRLVAYELLFRDAANDSARIADDAQATATVIAHAAELGMEQGWATRWPSSMSTRSG